MNSFFKRAVSAFSLMAGLILGSSCVGPREISADLADNGSTLKISTGDTLRLELESNPSTGYLWVFGAPFDPELLVMVSESYDREKDSDKRVGSPMKRIMTFKAVAPGRTGIKLDYKRPWERNEAPVKTYELLLLIDGAPLNTPPESDETPRVGSDGKVAKDPAKELFGK
jgi:inhibitor of cysteine peptidase